MSDRDAWSTPPALARLLIKEFGCQIDVCATADNAKCGFYLGPDHEVPSLRDGLATTWTVGCRDTVAWCNPPYSDIMPWVKKAIYEMDSGVETIMLIPQDSSVAWWREAVQHIAERRDLAGYVDSRGRYHSGRVQFVPPAGVTASSNTSASTVFRFLPGWTNPPHHIDAWDWQTAIKDAGL